MKGVARGENRAGQALVEAALLLPLLLILMLNGVNFGIYIYAWVTVNDAARAAAEYAVDNGVAAGFQGQPVFSQIQTLVNTTASTLPGYAAGTNPTLEICSNNNGTTHCAGAGGFPPPPPDPTAPARYTVYTADVAYAFKPIFSSSNGIIPLTLSNTIVHRRITMRSMQ